MDVDKFLTFFIMHETFENNYFSEKNVIPHFYFSMYQTCSDIQLGLVITNNNL